MPRKYTPQELTQLLRCVTLGETLEQITNNFGRSLKGIGQKLHQLSRDYPETWEPLVVAPYIAERNSNSWKASQNNPDRVREAREQVLAYLREHPKATSCDLRNDGLGSVFLLGYNNRINAVRRDAGIPERKVHGPPPLSLTFRTQLLIGYLKQHPDTTARSKSYPNFAKDISLFGGIDDARRAAGIVTSDYISAKEAAQKLGVTRADVSDLAKRGRLESLKVGSGLYITSASVEQRSNAKNNHP